MSENDAVSEGLFVAFEGGDGAGKSTQVRLLVEALGERRVDYLATREPGGSHAGDRIRELLLDTSQPPVDPHTEALLFAASRSAHVDQLIRPALKAGRVVITDRYVESSVAYQGAGRGLGTRRIRGMNEWATDHLFPDLTILLDMPVDAAAERRAQRVADRIEGAPADFHQRVREEFLARADLMEHRYLILDATADPQVLADIILGRVMQLLYRAARDD